MDSRPFVKPFKTIGNYYIYDVNTDTVLATTKESYEFLKSARDISEAAGQVKKELATLQEKGFLSSHTVKEIKHPATDLLPYYLTRKIEMIILQVTQNCNLRCKYCAYSGNYNNRTHNRVEMTFDMAKKGIDFLLSHSIDQRSISIGFYGGEPLLKFELIKKCIEYSKIVGEGKKIRYTITTNGTLITDDILHYLSDNDVNVMISLDGPKQIHDKGRSFAVGTAGSFDVLLKNIKYIKENYPIFYKNNLSFHTVVDPRNDFNCVNDFIAKTDLFEDSYFSSAMISELYIKKELEVPEDFICNWDYEEFKVMLHKLGRLDNRYISKLLMQGFEAMRDKRGGKQALVNDTLKDSAHHGGPCIAGKRRLFLNALGNFYPCERVSEASEMMKIGNIETGIDVEKAERLLNFGEISEDRCKQCWAFTYCSLCAASADALDNLSDDLVKSRCATVRNGVENMLKNYCTMRELGYDFECQQTAEKQVEVG